MKIGQLTLAFYNWLIFAPSVFNVTSISRVVHKGYRNPPNRVDTEAIMKVPLMEHEVISSIFNLGLHVLPSYSVLNQ